MGVARGARGLANRLRGLLVAGRTVLAALLPYVLSPDVATATIGTMVTAGWKFLFAQQVPGFWPPLAFTFGVLASSGVRHLVAALNPKATEGTCDVVGLLWRYKVLHGDLVAEPVPHCPACDLELRLPSPQVGAFSVVLPSFKEVLCQRPGCDHLVKLSTSMTRADLVTLARRVIEADLRVKVRPKAS
jgi:hypothetical protein